MKRFKYSFFLVLLLIPNLVFGGMGLGVGGRLGPNSFGIPLSLKDNLAVLIYNHDLTTSTLYDRANQYDFYQGTAANKGDVTTGPPKYLALDTDEYYPLREIDDETDVTFWPTYPGLTITATAAKILAKGFSNEALETYGAELAPTATCTDPLDDQDVTTGWTTVESTIDSIAGGNTGNALEITETGATGRARATIVTTVGATYRVTLYHKNGTTNGRVKVSDSALGLIYNSGTLPGVTAWERYSFAFIATTNPMYLEPYVHGSGGVTLFDDISVKQITNPGLSQFSVASGNSTHRGVLKDSAAAVIAWGYIRGADSAEAFGAELVTNGTFNSDIVGWNNLAGALYDTFEWGGAGVLHAVSDGTGNSLGGSDDNIAVVAGKTYILSYDYAIASGRITTIGLRQSVGAGTAWVSETNLTGTGSKTKYFTAPTTENIAFWFYNSDGNAGNFTIDNISLKEVTSFGTDGVLIGDDIAGTNQSWTGTGAGDPNDPSTLEIYKTIGSDNLTGDQTYGITVRLDDGRPAAAEVLFAHDSGAAGTRSLYAAVETTGKLTLYASEDGTNYEQVQTDDAVFADGAAASFTDLIFVLDKTTGTGAIYVNGSAVATTETITTGTLFDTYQPFEIGSKNGASYLNGDIGSIRVLNTTITATQAADQYNADAIQALINM